MAYSGIGSLGPGQLQEIQKLKRMGFNAPQIAKKMNLNRDLVYKIFDQLRERGE